MATHSAPGYHQRHPETDSGAFFKVAAVLLGILVTVLGFFALLMWADARKATTPPRSRQPRQTARAPGAGRARPQHRAAARQLCGRRPRQRCELAEAHAATNAALRRSPPETSSRCT